MKLSDVLDSIKYFFELFFWTIIVILASVPFRIYDHYKQKRMLEDEIKDNEIP